MGVIPIGQWMSPIQGSIKLSDKTFDIQKSLPQGLRTIDINNHTGAPSPNQKTEKNQHSLRGQRVIQGSRDGSERSSSGVTPGDTFTGTITETPSRGTAQKRGTTEGERGSDLASSLIDKNMEIGLGAIEVPNQNHNDQGRFERKFE